MATSVSECQVKNFRIECPAELLDDLQMRLKNTRWLHQPGIPGWKAGTNVEYLRELVDYWQHEFDWRLQERELNRFTHFTTNIKGCEIHYIHERGRGSDPFPIVLTHGYPDSFYRFVKLIPMLTDPVSYGGRAEDSFDVIVPDLPGYGFSRKPNEKITIFQVADLWSQLMTVTLGYERFGAHGGDWGSTVTEQLARDHAEAVAAIHLTDVPFGHLFQRPHDPSSDEKDFFDKNDNWMKSEGAYALIQSTKPQSLAAGLNDSPAGLAAWLVEKYQSWSDCDGDIESRFTKDEILTHIMIYWMTGTIGTSLLPYYEYAHAGAMTWMGQALKQWTGSEVPTAFAIFPKDISQPPRDWAERFFKVERWTEMSRGGHFAAMEEPEVLAEDLRSWFRTFRNKR